MYYLHMRSFFDYYFYASTEFSGLLKKFWVIGADMKKMGGKRIFSGLRIAELIKRPTLTGRKKKITLHVPSDNDFS